MMRHSHVTEVFVSGPVGDFLKQLSHGLAGARQAMAEVEIRDLVGVQQRINFTDRR